MPHKWTDPDGVVHAKRYAKRCSTCHNRIRGKGSRCSHCARFLRRYDAPPVIPSKQARN